LEADFADVDKSLLCDSCVSREAEKMECRAGEMIDLWRQAAPEFKR
jgi:hypothetical protein